MYENLDLKRERQNCPFDKEEITNLIDGGADKTDERRQLGKKKCHWFYLLSKICYKYNFRDIYPV